VPIRPTVIQIAHELSAIMDYDTVAVMAGGQVVEVGPPQVLAAQEGSRFNRLRAQEGH
jgi:ATP-binding cassette subfamily B protein